MLNARRSAAVVVVVAALTGQAVARAETVRLVVRAGRPLRVALDRRLVVHRVGQEVTGTVVEPIYAYDRIVVPVGTRVRGHIARLEPAARRARVRAMLSGDFSPLARPVVQFDRLLFADGRQVSIASVVDGEVANVTMSAAAQTEKTGAVAKARQAVSQRVHDTIGTITRPGKKERLEDAVIRRLPYHPQIVSKGTVLNAPLLAPVDFGAAASSPRAPAGALPAPESVLDARLVTALDSKTTPRGTPIEATIAEPVFSAKHELILPEGAELKGEVTYAKAARRFHHNGQLRFLFESVSLPGAAPAPLLASLSAVETSANDHVAVDEEGGATVANSKKRFIAPALSIMALRGAARSDYDADANGGAGAVRQGSASAQGFGGFLGFGLIGVGLAQISQPFGIAFAAIGVAQTTWSAVLAKGHEVTFPTDTPIQVQLAPGAAQAARRR